MNTDATLAARLCGALFPLLAALLAASLAACATPTDIEFTQAAPDKQKVVLAANAIRQLAGGDPARLAQQAPAARAHYEAGLAAWRASPGSVPGSLYGFEQTFQKLADAYTRFLLDASRPAEAADAFRTAIREADKDRQYQAAIALRIQLADTLVSIGQLESARTTLAQAQAVSDKVYGAQSFAADTRIDPFKLANHAALLSARIRAGSLPDRSTLANFVQAYQSTLERYPYMRFFSPSTSWMGSTVSTLLTDQNTYRQDQECWRAIAQAAVAQNDPEMARTALERMLASTQAAANNSFLVQDAIWRNNYTAQARAYRDTFYTRFDHLGLEKFSDPAAGREILFDYSLAAAELYTAIGDLAQAEQQLARARTALADVRRLSSELVSLGMLGLKDELRARELDRVHAHLMIRAQRWQEALALLEPYIAWSERYRESLSLEERLPYFRGTSQAVYRDAILARAQLYVQAPDDARFAAALQALGQLKARHLVDSLARASAASAPHAHAGSAALDAVLRSGSSFLSIADTGESLITYLADAKGRTLRIQRKPADFDRSVLALRNGLADQASFSPQAARLLTTQALGELEPRVFAARKLVLEIDGVLSFLPAELWLDARQTPLGLNTAVAYTPTLAMTTLARSAERGHGMLALGDARFDQQIQIDAINASGEAANRGASRSMAGFAPLPETRDEINGILQSVREGGKPLFGAEATKSAFFREAGASHYRYLHFATHGVVGGEIPTLLEPALVLTPEGRDAGFLTASEISAKPVNADLVVLSACNTGNGEYYNGEGLMGLGRAFIVAGTKSVVVSLWPVDSMSTKDLMIRFYKELESSGDARQALASARRAISDSEKSPAKPGDFRGRRNPFFWAPFILIEAGS